MQTNSAVESESPWNQPGRRGNGLRRLHVTFAESQVLSSEWNTKRVRKDKSGDSEDGEDNELSCVICESEGDCIWRGSREQTMYQMWARSTHSRVNYWWLQLFHRFLEGAPRRHKCFDKGVDRSAQNLVETLIDHCCTPRTK